MNTEDMNMQADFMMIKTERFRSGMNQVELAQKAKISLKTLVNAENGRSISPRTYMAIKRALGLE